MIEVYKIVNQLYDKNTTVNFDIIKDSITSGNKYRIKQNHCKYDLRKHFFTIRVIAIWNSLPNYVVEAHSLNIFKNRLDKHWCMQDVIYDFESDLSGTGNRSFE